MDVFSSAELAALPRRSECAASGVAQLQGRRGDHHIQRNTPDASSVRNTDPDYKYQHEGGRRKKDKDLISQAKHCATEYGDNCEYEQQSRPRMRVLLFIFRYPCVFCGIDTSLVSTWAPEPAGLSATNAQMIRLAVILASALSGFRCGFDDADGVLRNAMGLVDTLHLPSGAIGKIAVMHVNIRQQEFPSLVQRMDRRWSAAGTGNWN
jgi:hypothetical protein